MDYLRHILEDSLFPELEWIPIFSYEELEMILMSLDDFRPDHPLLTPLLIGKN